MKLLVRNLNRNTTEAEIKSLFEKCGAVQSCSLIMDVKTGLSKGFGFVEMPKQGEAKAAMKTLNGSSLAENVIRVKKASPKQEQSPELMLETSERQSGSKDKLHGVTLEMIVTSLVEAYGWSELGKRISIKCFTHEPSIGSSLAFLRKTLWAREKVELLYMRLNEFKQTPNNKKSTPEKSTPEKSIPKNLNRKTLGNSKLEPEKTKPLQINKVETSKVETSKVETSKVEIDDVEYNDDNEKLYQATDTDKNKLIESKVVGKKSVKKNPWGTIIEDDD